MKVSSQRIIFHSNFDYRHFVYQTNQKNIIQEIEGSYESVRID